jgi:hypothetical protein
MNVFYRYVYELSKQSNINVSFVIYSKPGHVTELF